MVPRNSAFARAAIFLGLSGPFTAPMYFRARSSNVFVLRGRRVIARISDRFMAIPAFEAGHYFWRKRCQSQFPKRTCPIYVMSSVGAIFSVPTTVWHRPGIPDTFDRRDDTVASFEYIDSHWWINADRGLQPPERILEQTLYQRDGYRVVMLYVESEPEEE